MRPMICHECLYVTETDPIIHAASHGHLDCLMIMKDTVDFRCADGAAKGAAVGGHLECLCFLRENGCAVTEHTAVAAACNGKLECLQYCHDVCGVSFEGDTWSMCKVAEHGQFECMEYMLQCGAELTEDLAIEAAARGDLRCLVYAHERGVEVGEDALRATFENSNTDCLRYVHEVCNVPIDGSQIIGYTLLYPGMTQETIEYIIVHCDDVPDYMYKHVQNIELLRCIHTKGVSIDSGVCAILAEKGLLDCLEYALDHCEEPLHSTVCRAAAANGHLDCLMLAHSKGAPLSADACDEAAERGHLGCLMYAHRNGAEVTWRMAYDAALCGHVDCLSYLREACGVPINFLIFNAATTSTTTASATCMLTCGTEKRSCVALFWKKRAKN